MLSVKSETLFVDYGYSESDDGGEQNCRTPPEIKGYHFVQSLGKSGCSYNYIYQGNDMEYYVVKVMKLDPLLFIKEVEFLDFCKDDDYVVDIVYYSQTNDQQMIITKYCEWGDLYDFVSNCEEGISNQLFINIVFELIKIIDFLHSNHIYHGDIKPANFFVKSYDPDTEDIKIVIGDFGYAKDMDKLIDPFPDGYTPTYCAPEIELGEEVSLSADIYSLGCVLKFLLDFISEEHKIQINLSLIQQMLSVNPRNRPTITKVGSIFEENIYEYFDRN